MNKNKRWVTFTYISPQIRKVTNIFRNTNVKIEFRCRNTIANLIKPSKDHNITPYNEPCPRAMFGSNCNITQTRLPSDVECCGEVVSCDDWPFRRVGGRSRGVWPELS